MITLYQQLDKKFQLRLQKHKVTSEEIIKHLFQITRANLQRADCPTVRLKYFGKFEVKIEYLFRKIKHNKTDKVRVQPKYMNDEEYDKRLNTLEDWLDLYECKLSNLNAVKHKRLTSDALKLDTTALKAVPNTVNEP